METDRLHTYRQTPYFAYNRMIVAVRGAGNYQLNLHNEYAFYMPNT